MLIHVLLECVLWLNEWVIFDPHICVTYKVTVTCVRVCAVCVWVVQLALLVVSMYSCSGLSIHLLLKKTTSE